MPWLDCYDIDSTLASLSAAIGTESAVLERVLCDYDSTRSGSGEDPEVRTPRDVLEQLGTTDSGVAERLAGAYCFHGTRVLDPETIRKCGLLPTTRIVEEVWATLRELVHDEINDATWEAFRASVENEQRYRLKVESAMNIGPNGVLIREILLNPSVSAVHYLKKGPEIVSDTAWHVRTTFGADLDLWQRYRDMSTPCIVRFRSTQRLPNAVNTALCYAFLKLRSGDLANNSSGYTGEGRAVSPEDVVDVALVTDPV